jgi:hypothetical protein
MKTLNALALGYAGAIISAICMLLLGILGNLGLYSGAVGMMEEWHMFFSPSVGGIIIGMIEAAIISFIILYAFALVYNLLVTRKSN